MTAPAPHDPNGYDAPPPDYGSELHALQDHFAELDIVTIGEELGRMDRVERASAFRLLPKDRALEVFEDLDVPLQHELIEELRGAATAEIFIALHPDDRASMLEELPAGIVAQLLSGLSRHERDMTTDLLGYPERSIGRRMTPEVVHIPGNATVGQALARVRAQGHDAETIYVLPVVGEGRKVTGVVSLRRLFLTPDDVRVGEVSSEPVMVRARDDQEDAARVVRDNGMIAVPVVDDEERLLGILTVDDAMRILAQEEAEDAARTGATAPLGRPYLSVGPFALVKARVGWLLILVAAATLTVNVLNHFEDALDQVVALALFVPLLIGTGGNAGSQSATTVVRALAMGEVRSGDFLRVLMREMSTGALLGVTLAGVGFFPAALFVGWAMAAVVAVTVISICILATSVGSLIPMIARWAGVDPAVVSAPFISTVVDATGLIVYFLVAQAILGI